MSWNGRNLTDIHRISTRTSLREEAQVSRRAVDDELWLHHNDSHRSH